MKPRLAAAQAPRDKAASLLRRPVRAENAMLPKLSGSLEAGAKGLASTHDHIRVDRGYGHGYRVRFHVSDHGLHRGDGGNAHDGCLQLRDAADL